MGALMYRGRNYTGSGGGDGDMTKAVYDTNDNGVVDSAESVMFGDTPVTFGIESGAYGYYDANNVFHDFKSQADIDSAVAAAKVGTAVAGDVLSGKTFTNSTTSGVNGSMTNNGAVSPSGLNCGGSYTIPEGYHNGQGVVTANSLASQTGVDSGKTAVGAGQMLTGYQAWVNGGKVSGTMENKGAWTPSNINPGGSVTIPAGYHNGSGKVTANANQNSGTKTITSSDTNWISGNVDMGANNTYRYVNAVNVYNKGKADGVPSIAQIKNVNMYYWDADERRNVYLMLGCCVSSVKVVHGIYACYSSSGVLKLYGVTPSGAQTLLKTYPYSRDWAHEYDLVLSNLKNYLFLKWDCDTTDCVYRLGVVQLTG